MPENLTDKTNGEIADLLADPNSIHFASALFEHNRRLDVYPEVRTKKGFENPSPPHNP